MIGDPMMRGISWRIVWSLGVLLAVASAAAEAPEVPVADRLFWTGPEGNMGLAIVGHFVSAEGRAEALSLNRVVGIFHESPERTRRRIWRLADVLVDVNMNTLSGSAAWRISGPRPLIESYLADLQAAYEDRSLFTGFGHSEVRFCPRSEWSPRDASASPAAARSDRPQPARADDAGSPPALASPSSEG